MTAPSPTVIQPTRPTSTADQLVTDLIRERKQQGRRRLLWGALTPVAVVLLWQLASNIGLLDEHFFPAPSTVLAESARYVTDAGLRDDLLTNLRYSGVRLATGFLLGSLLGLAVGLPMGLVPTVRYALGALINGTYPLPKLALYPLMIIFFGIGNASMVALVTLGVFFMVCINTVSGVTYSSPIYRDVADAFQLPRTTRLFRVTIPAAIPSIIGGLRLGFGQALIIVISTEFVSGQDGIGFIIWNSWQTLNVSAMFVGLVIVGFVGWLGSVAINALARRAVPWQHD
jgi:ABC-type nitrate/sulfonate/bicarbonate transport system permease component